jgi:hypothetical protein
MVPNTSKSAHGPGIAWLYDSIRRTRAEFTLSSVSIALWDLDETKELFFIEQCGCWQTQELFFLRKASAGAVGIRKDFLLPLSANRLENAISFLTPNVCML